MHQKQGICTDQSTWHIAFCNHLKSIVYFLLGNSPASEFYMPTFRNTSIFIGSHLLAYEDGTNRVFRNVGIYNSGAWVLPRRKHTTFRTGRKFEIKNLKSITKDLRSVFMIMDDLYLAQADRQTDMHDFRLPSRSS